MTGQTRWHHLGANAAEAYERHLVPTMFAPWAPHVVDLALVRPDARVLDVACGTGVVARLAAERAAPGGRVTGLDFNAAMLAVARSAPAPRGAPVEWVEGDALELPFAGAAFDAVTCQHGLQQFPDRARALGEMRRVLTPGGRLAACVWARLDGSPGMHALVDALERHVGAAAADNRRAPFRLADGGELRALVEAAGFREVHVETRVETARFADAAALVEAQLAATPAATLSGLTAEAVAKVIEEVRDRLAAYCVDGSLAVPMEAHLARGIA